MKKSFILLLALASLTWSCGGKGEKAESEDTKSEEKKDSESDENEESAEETTKIEFPDFDWSKIPASSADIGAFPYIALPKSMYITKHRSREKSKDPYTKMWDFSMLVMYDGKDFYKADGKRAFIDANMEDKKKDFNQYTFDKSVEDYLKKIGAVQIFKGQIPTELAKALNKQEGEMTCFEHIVGDVWNSDPIRHYALNHPNGKIFFQVWSNSAEGQIGVIELEGFKQTIKAPTASEMMASINKDGKAILNINFDTNKATLKADGEKIVNEISILLNDNPDLKLSIEGHTDNEGDPKANVELSQKRANTVKYALGAKGIDVERLSTQGFGGDKPLVPNDSDENKAKNRRVELVKK